MSLLLSLDTQSFQKESAFLNYLLQKEFINITQYNYFLLLQVSIPDSLIVSILESELILYHDLIKFFSNFTNTLVFDKSDISNVIGPYSQINLYCQRGYLEFSNKKNKICILVKKLDFDLIQYLKEYYPDKKIYISTKSEFFSTLEFQFAKYVIAYSQSFVKFINYIGAKHISYRTITISYFCMSSLLLIYTSTLLYIINISIGISQNLFKIALLAVALQKEQSFCFSAIDYCAQYPIYSILIPAYKEDNLQQIVSAITCLLYPKNKLDVKLLVEQDDVITNHCIDNMEVPFYIHVLKIPTCIPKTKPKALNFAMPYVVGQYLTIYDVEDIPNPDQLIKAIQMFQQLPLNYVCLQAKLKFYNTHENLLTKLMSIEYSVLFNFLIYGLSILNLPIPLGGTSNHFKTALLSQIGCWDAYNVAEDADLGIRIFSYKYRTSIIDSFTSEESPTDLWSWILQRSRWIKGYWQTFFVFWQQRKKYTILQTFAIYNFIIFSTYNLFILPLLFIFMLFTHNNYIQCFFLINNVIAILYVIASVIVGIHKLKLTHKKYEYILLIICYMFYFLFHFIASIIAIIELLCVPFKWRKTKHKLNIS